MQQKQHSVQRTRESSGKCMMQFTQAQDQAEDTGKYTKANLTIIAQGISGLDMTKFNSCLNNDSDLSKVQPSHDIHRIQECKLQHLNSS